MSRQAVFAHSGNVPDVGHEKLSCKRLSWMGAHKTESVLVTYEDTNRVAQAEEARKQREKIMNNIRMQLSRINEMLESPEREKNSNNNGTRSIESSGDGSQQQPSPSSAMGSARARHADPKQLVSYLDGSTHSRFSIANYNSYVRTKMMEIMEAHPPNSEWPVLPTDEEFPVPPISEGTGISPSNVTSAPTWRDMLGGRGTIGYNTKASACAKELFQYEHFKGVNFADGFNDKASSSTAGSSPQNTETARGTAASGDETARPADEKKETVTAAAAPTTEETKPAAATTEQQQQQQQEAPKQATTTAAQEPVAPPAVETEKKAEEQAPAPAATEEKKAEEQQQPAAAETTQQQPEAAATTSETTTAAQ